MIMDWGAIRDKPVRYAIGLVSGSSCTGVEAALVRIKGSGPSLIIKLVASRTFPYTTGLRTRLMAPRMDVTEAALLNFVLGECLAEAALEMMEIAKGEDVEVDFIALRGHTASHVPPRGEGAIGTLEIGEPAVLVERTGLPAVSDFRPRDMAAGGQGAPLAAYADWLLFKRNDRTVARLHIGGVARITVVTPELENVLAFESGPGTLAIDTVARLLTAGTQEMDPDGAAAAKGVVIDEFLEYLLDHPYLTRVPPKSISRNDFAPDAYLRDALAGRRDRPFEDLIATVTAAVAYSVIRAYSRFIKPQHTISRLIVSGGGVRNKALIGHLKRGLSDVTVRSSDHYGLAHDAMQAVAYAILGNETLCGLASNIPTATSARRPVVLGCITPNGPCAASVIKPGS